jgi:hypothetical protein
MRPVAQFSTDSAEQRLGEIAKILAQGILRLPPRRLSPETALGSAALGLEQSAKTRLSITNGLRSESPEPRRHQ